MFKLSRIFRSTSYALIIVLTFSSAVLLIAPSDAMAVGQTHTITIINNCSDSLGINSNGIYIGLNSKSKPTLIQAHLNRKDLCTGKCPNGWNMKKGDTAVILVPMPWTSGAIWARTGCEFDGDVCPTASENCCDTGGCTDSSGKTFQIDCGATPVPPVTVSEFTFDAVKTNSDFVDTSIISGANASVQVVPGPITKSGDLYAININNANAVQILGENASCIDDTECENSGAYFKCVNLACSEDSECTNVAGWPDGSLCMSNKCSKGVCVNPYWAGSPGCTDPNGCASKVLGQSLLEPSGWGNIPCSSADDCPNMTDTCTDGSCVNEDGIPYYNYALNNQGVNNSCPINISLPVGAMKSLITIDTLEYFNRGMNGQLNQGKKYVGCISPQEFCTMSCSTEVPVKNCPAGLTCEDNICGLNRACTEDSDCVQGQTCVDSLCSPRQAVGAPCDLAINDTCMDNDDCVHPATCQSGMCKGNDPVSGFPIIPTTAGDLWGCTGSNAGSCYSDAPNKPEVCTNDSQCATGHKCVQQCAGNGACETKQTCNFNSNCGIVAQSSGPLCLNGVCVAQSVCSEAKPCTMDTDCPKPGGGNNICNKEAGLCTQTETQQCFSNDFCAPSLDADIGALPLVAVPVPNTNNDIGIICNDQSDCRTKALMEAYKFTPLTCSEVRCDSNADCQSGICNKISGAPGTYGTCKDTQCVFQEFFCQTDESKPNFGKCVNPNCCGCPQNIVKHFCTTGNNDVWQEMAQMDIAEVFKKASDTSYSFPFDDKTSQVNLSSQVGPTPLGTFTGCQSKAPTFCQMITGDSGATCDTKIDRCVASKLTSYTLTFCPAP